MSQTTVIPRNFTEVAGPWISPECISHPYLGIMITFYFCSSDLWCCQYSSPAWYSGIADWWRPHGQVVTETHKITLPDENKLAMDDLCLLEWTDKSYFGRIPSGGMNLKGFDRWEHSEQSHKDKQMQDIESDWLTDTLKNIYWAPTKLTLLSL